MRTTSTLLGSDEPCPQKDSLPKFSLLLSSAIVLEMFGPIERIIEQFLHLSLYPISGLIRCANEMNASALTEEEPVIVTLFRR